MITGGAGGASPRPTSAEKAHFTYFFRSTYIRQTYDEGREIDDEGDGIPTLMQDDEGGEIPTLMH